MSKIVDTIHTLRGEYFRHSVNQKRVKPKPPVAHQSPTLPADLLTDAAYSREKPLRPRNTREALFVARRDVKPSQHDLTTTAARRAEALSIVLPAVLAEQSVPPLTLLCLQVLVASFDTDFETILPFIPLHLRHDLLRWTAIHNPLTNRQLHALCGPDGHVAGELIIIPPASMREEQFKHSEVARSKEWESDDWLPPPLHTFILVSERLSFSALSSLPATITHLALVNLSAAVSLHRITVTCPLVECLDLSYNAWLLAEHEARERLGKVQWSRWHHLRILGLRGCRAPADIVVEVNKGRWDDVKIVN
ncbi:hypothetical protein C8R43DRAFT_1098832 [Mycena crocata]|nr:hypothetical protein C8R43DRAFT_1098832 [Mycena crocata]